MQEGTFLVNYKLDNENIYVCIYYCFSPFDIQLRIMNPNSPNVLTTNLYYRLSLSHFTPHILRIQLIEPLIHLYLV